MFTGAEDSETALIACGLVFDDFYWSHSFGGQIFLRVQRSVSPERLKSMKRWIVSTRGRYNLHE